MSQKTQSQQQSGDGQSQHHEAPKRPAEVLSSEQRKRKQQVLTRGRAAATESIAAAMVIKDGNVCFLSRADGSIPMDGHHAFGLYYHDCRYLDGYQIKLGGKSPHLLINTVRDGFKAIYELTNEDIDMPDGRLLSREQIGMRWTRTLDGQRRVMFEKIELQNFALEAVEVSLTLGFRCQFHDIYNVRGMAPMHPGHLLHSGAWDEGRLWMLYQGGDKVYRSMTIGFDPQPDDLNGREVTYHVSLAPAERKTIELSLTLFESMDRSEHWSIGPKDSQDHCESETRRQYEDWLRRHVSVETDNWLVNRVIDRSIRDLRVLRSHLDGEQFFAAGVPWFITLFGRDSVIAAIQMLPFDPGIAEQTLRVLASYQGRQDDAWRDEQPGKILHELRVGELANMNLIPHTPYYGTVDATPLFLILAAMHADWVGHMDLVHELAGPLARALEWIDRYADSDQDGYIDYCSRSKHGLINQGWKDSGNAIVNADGSLAEPPIALVEVQAYVYLARQLMAKLYRRDGDSQRADRLDRQAEDLRQRLNRDFWLDELGFYAMALQRDMKPTEVIASNPGHALWAGIADEDKAHKVIDRLMADDMFSGWGIRTLATGEKRYNPVSYHLGTVWPHDNSIIAAGFRRYGRDAEAARLFESIVDAARHFGHYRLPELFCGFPRDDYDVPVPYPVACHPQAWGAGSVPYLLTVMLGLRPLAFDGRLEINKPMLTGLMNQLTLRGLRVGQTRVDLQFRKTAKRVEVDVLDQQGELDVQVNH